MNDANVKKAKKWANQNCQGSWAFSTVADNWFDKQTGKLSLGAYMVLTDPEDAMMWELQNQKRIKMLMIHEHMPFFYKYSG
jgi:hypothetical protein